MANVKKKVIRILHELVQSSQTDVNLYTVPKSGETLISMFVDLSIVPNGTATSYNDVNMMIHLEPDGVALLTVPTTTGSVEDREAYTLLREYSACFFDSTHTNLKFTWQEKLNVKRILKEDDQLTLSHKSDQAATAFIVGHITLFILEK